jgi:hypothetical protein
MSHNTLSLHDLSQLVIMQTKSGRTKAEIVKVLVERGWPEASAVHFVNATLSTYKAGAAPEQAPEDQRQPEEPDTSPEQEYWLVFLMVMLVVVIVFLCSSGLLAR